MSLINELNPTPRFLMGPGPSDVHPCVLKAMAMPPIGHLDPQFIMIMDDVMKMLRQLFRTKNQLTFAVSGTGSAGMDALPPIVIPLVKSLPWLKQLQELVVDI